MVIGSIVCNGGSPGVRLLRADGGDYFDSAWRAFLSARPSTAALRASVRLTFAFERHRGCLAVNSSAIRSSALSTSSSRRKATNVFLGADFGTAAAYTPSLRATIKRSAIQPQPNARWLISISKPLSGGLPRDRKMNKQIGQSASESLRTARDLPSALFHGRLEKKSLNIRAVEQPSLVAGPVFKTGEGR